MTVSMKDLLRQLSELQAPTGDEEEVASFMEKHLRAAGFDVRRDVLGNVIARKGSGGKKIMIAAHMDEISVAVTSVTKDGFIKFAKIGGIYDGVLGGARVTLHAKQKILGVIGMKPPHLMKEEEAKKLQETEALFIDVGAKNKQDAEKLGIRPGVQITFASKFAELEGGLVVGKAFDDRSGCAVLLKLAEMEVPKEVTLFLVGTVREETGLWGAGTSAFGIEPDFAVALDVCLGGGTPDVPEDSIPVKLGGGPAISVIEAGGRGLIMSRKLVDFIEGVARKNKIPHQFEVSDRGATDASRMQYVRAGVLAASIGIPSRYIHSQNEVIALSDLDATAKLLKALVSEFPNYK
ncbi:MAG: M42 family metallopeptidase [Candidatus Norongarragalinales archaeon]